jgi:hypothetical protein
MKDRLLKELQELDLAIAKLTERRGHVTIMVGTLATLVALEPRIGDHMNILPAV